MESHELQMVVNAGLEVLERIALALETLVEHATEDDEEDEHPLGFGVLDESEVPF